MSFVLPVQKVASCAASWQVLKSYTDLRVSCVTLISPLTHLVETLTQLAFIEVWERSNQHALSFSFVLAFSCVSFNSIAFYQIKGGLAIEVDDIDHDSVDFAGQISLNLVLLSPCIEHSAHVELPLDELASFEESSHLLGLLHPEVPLAQSLLNCTASQSFLKILCSHLSVSLFRCVYLPSDEPVLESFFLNASTFNHRVMFLYVLSFDIVSLDHLAHFFCSLHLEHHDIVVLLFSPFSHGGLHSVLLVYSKHFAWLFFLLAC